MRLLRPLCVLAMTGMLLAGCVKRTLLIESDPPGAKVWINETPAGITAATSPVSKRADSGR